MIQTSPKTVLVIGATGGIGSEVAKAFTARGWHVRALSREPASAATRFAGLGPVTWVKGDAMHAAAVAEAAAGTDVIFHGANPPDYKDWRDLAMPMLENSIHAARTQGARLVFPGNVYNFAPDAFPLLRETSPQNPKTVKGKIRKEMEEMLAQAARGDVRVLVVRAGDFIGPHAPGSWFSRVLIKPGKPVRAVTYPGALNVGHTWAYLPDLAETIARLVEVEDRLEACAVVHFGGHWLEGGADLVAALRRVTGAKNMPVKRFPWPVLYILSPFVPMFHELIEMRYLWREPVRLDNAKLVSLLGAEPHTPLDEALRATLGEMGCLGNTKSPTGTPN